MEVKFKKISPKAVLPKKGYPSDTCYDLTAVWMKKEGQFIEYGTGICIKLPRRIGAYIRPRSSISKYDLIMCNSPGTIDNQYTGEIKVRFKDLRPWWKKIFGLGKLYEVGDRICQLGLEKTIKIDWDDSCDLGESIRGDKGFGSSDYSITDEQNLSILNHIASQRQLYPYEQRAMNELSDRIGKKKPSKDRL